MIDDMTSIDFSDKIYTMTAKSLDQTFVKIFEHYLAIEPLTLDFSTSNPYSNKFITLIRLLRLPVTFYNHSLIIEIDDSIGFVVKIDYQTKSDR
ncbi:hypothetical protein GQ457_10G015760 [Hibiscus cannabinus]